MYLSQDYKEKTCKAIDNRGAVPTIVPVTRLQYKERTCKATCCKITGVQYLQMYLSQDYKERTCKFTYCKISGGST